MSEAEPRPPRPPVLRFHLVCPGETEDQSFIPDFSGHSDPDLSALGRQQATAMASVLAQVGARDVDAVYSSPLVAAETTAQLLSEALDLPEPQISTSLATIWPESLPDGNGGLDVLRAMQERIWAAIETLRDRHGPEGAVLLVSHLLPLRALVCKALNIPLEEAERFQIEPASLSSLEFRGQRTILSCLNDVCHLE